MKHLSDTAPRLAGERGAVAVEFALVLPVLAMLVFGIVEFGRGFNAKIELTGAVREGARALALSKPADEVEQAVIDAAPGLDPPPTVTIVDACPNDEDAAVVTAEYSLDYEIPLSVSGTWDISVTGVMRCGV